jgi:hypothetical protein
MEPIASLLEEGTRWECMGTVVCAAEDIAWHQRRWALHARYLLWVMEERPVDPAWCRSKHFPTGAVLDALEFSNKHYASPLQEQRCRLLAQALREQRAIVGELLSPLRPESVSQSEFDAFLVEQRGQFPTLWNYVFNIYRDWSWGEKEIERSFKTVNRLWGAGRKPERILVPGAGAGRLAYELHNRLRPCVTCAIDMHPLLALVAGKMVRGEKMTVFEFPTHPLDLSSAAVRRELSAPSGPARTGLVVLLADVTKRALRRRSFDCIVTNWFIDAVPGVSITDLFATLNQLLVAGGVWINIGPTMRTAVAADVETIDEVMTAVPRAGFRLDDSFRRFERYLASPVDATHRYERVVGFRATKIQEVEAPFAGASTATPKPSWLDDTSVPVAIDAPLQDYAAAHRVTADVLLEASNALSLDEISAVIASRFNLPLGVARQHSERTLRAVAGA